MKISRRVYELLKEASKLNENDKDLQQRRSEIAAETQAKIAELNLQYPPGFSEVANEYKTRKDNLFHDLNVFKRKQQTDAVNVQQAKIDKFLARQSSQQAEAYLKAKGEIIEQANITFAELSRSNLDLLSGKPPEPKKNIDIPPTVITPVVKKEPSKKDIVTAHWLEFINLYIKSNNISIPTRNEEEADLICRSRAKEMGLESFFDTIAKHTEDKNELVLRRSETEQKANDESNITYASIANLRNENIPPGALPERFKQYKLERNAQLQAELQRIQQDKQKAFDDLDKEAKETNDKYVEIITKAHHSIIDTISRLFENANSQFSENEQENRINWEHILNKFVPFWVDFLSIRTIKPQPIGTKLLGMITEISINAINDLLRSSVYARKSFDDIQKSITPIVASTDTEVPDSTINQLTAIKEKGQEAVGNNAVNELLIPKDEFTTLNAVLQTKYIEDAGRVHKAINEGLMPFLTRNSREITHLVSSFLMRINNDNAVRLAIKNIIKDPNEFILTTGAELFDNSKKLNSNDDLKYLAPKYKQLFNLIAPDNQPFKDIEKFISLLKNEDAPVFDLASLFMSFVEFDTLYDNNSVIEAVDTDEFKKSEWYSNLLTRISATNPAMGLPKDALNVALDITKTIDQALIRVENGKNIPGTVQYYQAQLEKYEDVYAFTHALFNDFEYTRVSKNIGVEPKFFTQEEDAEKNKILKFQYFKLKKHIKKLKADKVVAMREIRKKLGLKGKLTREQYSPYYDETPLISALNKYKYETDVIAKILRPLLASFLESQSINETLSEAIEFNAKYIGKTYVNKETLELETKGILNQAIIDYDPDKHSESISEYLFDYFSNFKRSIEVDPETGKKKHILAKASRDATEGKRKTLGSKYFGAGMRLHSVDLSNEQICSLFDQLSALTEVAKPTIISQEHTIVNRTSTIRGKNVTEAEIVGVTDRVLNNEKTGEQYAIRPKQLAVLRKMKDIQKLVKYIEDSSVGELIRQIDNLSMSKTVGDAKSAIEYPSSNMPNILAHPDVTEGPRAAYKVPPPKTEYEEKKPTSILDKRRHRIMELLTYCSSVLHLTNISKENFLIELGGTLDSRLTGNWSRFEGLIKHVLSLLYDGQIRAINEILYGDPKLFITMEKIDGEGKDEYKQRKDKNRDKYRKDFGATREQVEWELDSILVRIISTIVGRIKEDLRSAEATIDTEDIKSLTYKPRLGRESKRDLFPGRYLHCIDSLQEQLFAGLLHTISSVLVKNKSNNTETTSLPQAATGTKTIVNPKLTRRYEEMGKRITSPAFSAGAGDDPSSDVRQMCMTVLSNCIAKYLKKYQETGKHYADFKTKFAQEVDRDIKRAFNAASASMRLGSTNFDTREMGKLWRSCLDKLTKPEYDIIWQKYDNLYNPRWFTDNKQLQQKCIQTVTPIFRKAIIYNIKRQLGKARIDKEDMEKKSSDLFMTNPREKVSIPGEEEANIEIDLSVHKKFKAWQKLEIKVAELEKQLDPDNIESLVDDKIKWFIEAFPLAIEAQAVNSVSMYSLTGAGEGNTQTIEDTLADPIHNETDRLVLDKSIKIFDNLLNNPFPPIRFFKFPKTTSTDKETAAKIQQLTVAIKDIKRKKHTKTKTEELETLDNQISRLQSQIDNLEAAKTYEELDEHAIVFINKILQNLASVFQENLSSKEERNAINAQIAIINKHESVYTKQYHTILLQKLFAFYYSREVVFNTLLYQQACLLYENAYLPIEQYIRSFNHVFSNIRNLPRLYEKQQNADGTTTQSDDSPSILTHYEIVKRFIPISLWQNINSDLLDYDVFNEITEYITGVSDTKSEGEPTKGKVTTSDKDTEWIHSDEYPWDPTDPLSPTIQKPINALYAKPPKLATSHTPTLGIASNLAPDVADRLGELSTDLDKDTPAGPASRLGNTTDKPTATSDNLSDSPAPDIAQVHSAVTKFSKQRVSGLGVQNINKQISEQLDKKLKEKPPITPTRPFFNASIKQLREYLVVEKQDVNGQYILNADGSLKLFTINQADIEDMPSEDRSNMLSLIQYDLTIINKYLKGTYQEEEDFKEEQPTSKSPTDVVKNYLYGGTKSKEEFRKEAETSFEDVTSIDFEDLDIEERGVIKVLNIISKVTSVTDNSAESMWKVVKHCEDILNTLFEANIISKPYSRNYYKKQESVPAPEENKFIKALMQASDSLLKYSDLDKYRKDYPEDTRSPKDIYMDIRKLLTQIQKTIIPKLSLPDNIARNLDGLITDIIKMRPPKDHKGYVMEYQGQGLQPSLINLVQELTKLYGEKPKEQTNESLLNNIANLLKEAKSYNSYIVRDRLPQFYKKLENITSNLPITESFGDYSLYNSDKLKNNIITKQETDGSYTLYLLPKRLINTEIQQNKDIS